MESGTPAARDDANRRKSSAQGPSKDSATVVTADRKGRPASIALESIMRVSGSWAARRCSSRRCAEDSRRPDPHHTMAPAAPATTTATGKGQETAAMTPHPAARPATTRTSGAGAPLRGASQAGERLRGFVRDSPAGRTISQAATAAITIAGISVPPTSMSVTAGPPSPHDPPGPHSTAPRHRPAGSHPPGRPSPTRWSSGRPSGVPRRDAP